MNRIEIEFEEQGIESLLGPVQPGQRVSAAGLLTLLVEGSEEQLLEALDYLQEQGAVLDTGELPKAYGQSEAAVRLRREEQLVREGRLMTELEDKTGLLKRFMQMKEKVSAIEEAAAAIRTINYRQYENADLQRLVDIIAENAAALKE